MEKLKSHAFLLCLLVFAVFYVSVFAEISIVDDLGTLTDFHNNPASPGELLLPRSVGGYYRPLIGLSYLVNLRLWDLDGKTLHLENVLMHVAAALMVYLLAREVLRRQGRVGKFAPLVAGLLFGLHPIVTESVNWISGRTDLIAGFFVFLAAWLTVRYLRSRSLYLLAGAALSVLVGLLAKETALGFIPGAILLLMARQDEEAGEPQQLSPYRELLLLVLFGGGTVAAEVVLYNFWIWLATAPLYLFTRHCLKCGGLPGRDALLLVARRALFCAVGLLLAAAIFYGIRKAAFSGDLPRFPQTLKLMREEFNYTLEIFLGGVGFYVKKFFCPFPLNFTIREIDPSYPLLGTFLCFLGLFLATRRGMASSLALAGVFLFAPALPLAFGTVAWTAYAERYIYISTGFWSVALVLYAAPPLQRCGRAGVATVLLLLLSMAGATLQRNVTWLTNLALMRDTVQKSPRFREVHVMYMSELLKKGDLAGAREQYLIASSLPCIGYNERLDGLMAEVYLREGKEEEALGVYRKILRKTRGASAAVRLELEELLQAKAGRVKDPAERQAALLELGHLRSSAPARALPAGKGKAKL